MYCYLCTNNYAGISQTFCEKCIRLRRIINLYNIEKVLETCEFIFLRDSHPIEKRAEKIIEDKKKILNKYVYIYICYFSAMMVFLY